MKILSFAVAFSFFVGCQQGQTPELLVYCAPSVRQAVESLAKAYERDHGVRVNVQYGASGVLESQIKLSGKGDLYIPAAAEPFLSRLRETGEVEEAYPLAEMHLVLGVNLKCPDELATLDELLASEHPFGLANEQAAAGDVTRRVLEQHGKWEAVRDKSKASLPTVTELAEGIRQGVALQAGFVWDVTAKQFELRAVEYPELENAIGQISAAILTSSDDPAAANKFANFLATSPEAREEFERGGYKVAPR